MCDCHNKSVAWILQRNKHKVCVSYSIFPSLSFSRLSFSSFVCCTIFQSVSVHGCCTVAHTSHFAGVCLCSYRAIAFIVLVTLEHNTQSTIARVTRDTQKQNMNFEISSTSALENIFVASIYWRSLFLLYSSALTNGSLVLFYGCCCFCYEKETVGKLNVFSLHCRKCSQ